MYSLSKTTIGSIFTVPLEKETLPENAQKAEFAFVDSEALTGPSLPFAFIETGSMPL